MADPGNIILSCLVVGDDVSKSFSLKISPANLITELNIDIVTNYRMYQNEELTGLKLVQCSLPEDQLSSIPSLPNEPLLSARKFVKDYWPDPSAIDQRLIQVLVYAASFWELRLLSFSATGRSRAVPATLQTPSVTELTDTFRQLTIAQERTRRKILDGPSASIAAQPKAFMKQQNRDDAPIYNGRPWDRTGKPIEIYHPAFRIFLDTLNQEDTPSGLDYISTENLLRDSQATYDHEDKRGIALKTHLSIILGRDISSGKVSGCMADGVIKWRAPNNALQAYYSVLELKDEIGGSTCDPSIQGAESYAMYWCQDEANPIRKLSCCPSFILAVAGPWMCILGGVYLTQIVVQPLTEMLWVADHPQKESRLKYLTRVFAALRDAIDNLDAYYQPLVSNASSTLPREDPARFYPDICRFQGRDGGETKLVYLEDLTRLAFKAQTEDRRFVVVKFVERYNATAHELLAHQDLAPKLLFDSADHLYGGYRMVVMDFIPGKPLSEYSELEVGLLVARKTLQLIRPSLELALVLLHGANFVFGDLRPPNIMVVEENGETKAKLIDFDWCAVAGEGRYPVNLSGNITWPAGVERGGLIQKAHDSAMFDSIFP
ncbi:unnamed protein product [Rhizoctonia solani]|nr:unnamed protein product [Rhizoctonia solani]